MSEAAKDSERHPLVPDPYTWQMIIDAPIDHHPYRIATPGNPNEGDEFACLHATIDEAERRAMLYDAELWVIDARELVMAVVKRPGQRGGSGRAAFDHNARVRKGWGMP